MSSIYSELKYIKYIKIREFIVIFKWFGWLLVNVVRILIYFENW